MVLGSDPEAVRGATLDKGVARRAWAFARPFRWSILGFLVIIGFDAVIGLAPPLLFRAVLDTAIPEGDKTLVVVLATVTVLVALADAALGVAQRWFGARVGEGMIFRLRTAVFDKVQQMPIAFFTRTQTGALVSRLNNDVIGAQSAVTGTLGSVVCNVITLVATLTAMLLLEWRLTLLTLVVLPLFIIPAKRVGRAMQRITRRQMDINAQMNTQMTERFNVAGAMLVKLFGARAHRVVRVPGPGRPGARHRHQVGDVRPRVLRGPGTGGGHGRRGGVRRRGVDGDRRHDHRRHARRPGGLRHPAVRAADEPHEHPGRGHDGAGELRAGVRGARCPRRHPGPSRGLRPDLAGRPHPPRPRLVPLPAGLRGVDRLARDPPERRRRRSVGDGRAGDC